MPAHCGWPWAGLAKCPSPCWLLFDTRWRGQCRKLNRTKLLPPGQPPHLIPTASCAQRLLLEPSFPGAGGWRDCGRGLPVRLLPLLATCGRPVLPPAAFWKQGAGHPQCGTHSTPQNLGFGLHSGRHAQVRTGVPQNMALQFARAASLG